MTATQTPEEAVIRAQDCVRTQRPLAWGAVAILLAVIGEQQQQIRRLERQHVAGGPKT